MGTNYKYLNKHYPEVAWKEVSAFIVGEYKDKVVAFVNDSKLLKEQGSYIKQQMARVYGR
jgi:hypothetical protein